MWEVPLSSGTEAFANKNPPYELLGKVVLSRKESLQKHILHRPLFAEEYLRCHRCCLALGQHQMQIDWTLEREQVRDGLVRTKGGLRESDRI